MRKLLLLFVATILILNSEITNAQDTPPMGMSAIQSYSVFMDAYRIDDFDMAIQFGEWMLNAKPKTIENHARFSLVRHFDRMVSVYSGKANSEIDPSISSEYYRKALAVFEDAFETFDEDEMDYYEWNLNYGRYLHEHSSVLNAGMSEIAAKYLRAFEVDPKKLSHEADGYFLELILNHYASAGVRDSVFSVIEQVEPFASAELMAMVNRIRVRLFESPEERIDFYGSQLEIATQEEKEKYLLLLIELYKEMGDFESAEELAKTLYELNPNYENTNRLVDMYLDDGKYQVAAEYLKEMFRLAENEDVRKEVALQMAVAYQQLQQLREARDFVREALQIDQNFGSAYMRMASIYAGTVSQCTGGEALERDDRTVYWLVIDYLERAKNADPSLARGVEQQLNLYRNAMPTVNDKFFRNWEVGDSFWINESIGECYAWIDEQTTIK